MSDWEKAILVVSFGTSHDDTREKTLDRIEEDVREAYPSRLVCRAWTSGMIRGIIEKRDGVSIPDVGQAMRQIADQGVRSLIVQPTHVLNGVENFKMLRQISDNAKLFSELAVGSPLLTSRADHDYMVRAVAEEFAPAEDEVLVLMGHGTSDFADDAYAALDYEFKDLGFSNIFIGTVEGYPGLDSLVRRLRAYASKRVILAPFMIVAGEHVRNDLAGDAPGSWKSRLEAEGYEVSCVCRGLGEYDSVRRLFLKHIESADANLQSGGGQIWA